MADEPVPTRPPPTSAKNARNRKKKARKTMRAREKHVEHRHTNGHVVVRAVEDVGKDYDGIWWTRFDADAFRKELADAFPKEPPDEAKVRLIKKEWRMEHARNVTYVLDTGEFAFAVIRRDENAPLRPMPANVRSQMNKVRSQLRRPSVPSTDRGYWLHIGSWRQVTGHEFGRAKFKKHAPKDAAYTYRDWAQAEQAALARAAAHMPVTGLVGDAERYTGLGYEVTSGTFATTVDFVGATHKDNDQRDPKKARTLMIADVEEDVRGRSPRSILPVILLPLSSMWY